MDILGKRYWYFALSLIIIVPGVWLALTGKAPLSIDFVGGSLTEVRLTKAEQILPADVKTLVEALGLTDSTIQTSENKTVLIRTKNLDETTREALLKSLQTKYGEAELLRFEDVGPTIGQEVAWRGALAVGVAALAVVIYITFTFRSIPHAFRYGLCAIAAMLHDVLIVFSAVGLGGYFLGWQIDALFLTALLTVIGFSVQDKIVVFDRIRENSLLHRRATFESLANHSIIQTLQRSINTQLMTVEFMLLALAMFGGVTLREFAMILLVGLFSGTYSSIFIAAPLLVVWENNEWGRFFGRKTERAA